MEIFVDLFLPFSSETFVPKYIWVQWFTQYCVFTTTLHIKGTTGTPAGGDKIKKGKHITLQFPMHYQQTAPVDLQHERRLHVGIVKTIYR